MTKMVRLKTIILLVILLTCCKQVQKEEPFSNNISEPQILAPNVISTRDFHESMNFYDSDEQTIYFTRSDKEFKTSTLYYSKFENGTTWNIPEILPFSGEHYDANLSFFPNKETVYFTSKRNPQKEGLSKEWNIWKVQKNKTKWEKPEVLPFPINSNSSECCLTINENGQAFFASDRNGSWDIYQVNISNNGINGLKKLSTKINSNDGEWPGYINDQANILVFSSIRKSGIGGDDLYFSRKIGESWSEPKIMDTLINTVSYEDNPFITRDGRFFLFSSQRKTEFSEKVSNIYYISSDKIDDLEYK